MIKKSYICLLLVGLMSIVFAACDNTNTGITDSDTEKTVIERTVAGESELEHIVSDLVHAYDWADTELSEISVQKDSEKEDETFILHITFTYDHQTSEPEARLSTETQSFRLLGSLAHSGITNVSGASVLWHDHPHDRVIEYVFRYRNGRRQNRFSLVETIEHE